jgi:hypothetical protein
MKVKPRDLLELSQEGKKRRVRRSLPYSAVLNMITSTCILTSKGKSRRVSEKRNFALQYRKILFFLQDFRSICRITRIRKA